MSKIMGFKSLALLVGASLCAAEVQAQATDKVATTGKYIVMFEQNLPEKQLADLLAATPGARIEKTWDGGINAALVAGLSAQAADRLRRQHGVISADPERILSRDAAQPAMLPASRVGFQTESVCNPWLGTWCQSTPGNLRNLDRIDHRALSLDQFYTYDYTGQGVVIYVVDSGVQATHNEFADPNSPGNSRASLAYNAFPGETHLDQSGHGTHVASIAAGTTYGVAKRAQIRSVRVCHNIPIDGEVCPESAMLDGLQYISNATTAGVGPRVVVNISVSMLSFSSAVASKINYLAGVKRAYVVSASGNQGQAVCNATHPALNAAGNHVVGSVTGSDLRYGDSNWGTCVFLHAPGTFIVGAATGPSNSGFRSDTGTSQAAPHVSGAAALILEQFPDHSVLDVHDVLMTRAAGAPFLPAFWNHPDNRDVNQVTPMRVLCTRNTCTSELSP